MFEIKEEKTIKEQIPKFGLLQGVKVVSAVLSVAGPLIASIFAENGADVISVENATGMDPVRFTPYWYAADHRNQRQMTLDVSVPEGSEVFKRLLKDADVFIETSKGKTYDKWGLSDEELWEFNPKLVIVHLSGFGQSGDPEYVNRGSFDYIGQAFSGLMLHNGTPDMPNYIRPYGADYIMGLQAAWAAMAALFNAQRTGKGESIDVAQFETLLRLQAHFPLYGFMHGAEAYRYSTLDSSMAGDNSYKTKDGKYVTICVQGSGPIMRALPLVGMEDYKEDFEGITMMLQTHPRAEQFVQGLRDFCLARTAEEASDELNAAQIPCSRALTYSDMLEHPHYKARETIIEYFSPHANETVKGAGAFPKFKKNPQIIWRGGACLGQENEEIMKEHGYSDAEIQKLYDKKIMVKGGPVSVTESEKIARGEKCALSDLFWSNSTKKKPKKEV